MSSTTPRPTTAVVRRLAPGVHVVPRDDQHVQVGLDPPARVVVRRRPDLLAVLDGLVRGRLPDPLGPQAAALLASLEAAGLLAGHDTAAPTRTARPTGTVAVVDRGLGLGDLTRLLVRSGLRPARPGRSPDLHVVGSPAPVPRASLDGWLGEGAPHLVLAGTGVPGSLRLGPLVEPGVTACVRCVDAAEAIHDPRRTLVVEQLAALPTRSPDPAVLTLALAWAAREAATYVAGGRPLTWSTTVDLDGPAPVVRTWERHPHCGCAWDVLPY